jgi:hypothetical protein
MKRENSIRAHFEVARIAIRAVITGSKPMQMICSDPGLGKSQAVEEECRKAGIKASHVTPTNVASFVKELYDHRNKPVAIFDDCDRLLRSETCANIAKMAFGPQRMVIHNTVEARKNEQRRKNGDPKYDSGIPPQRFHFRAKLIWCSNLNFSDPAIIKSHMKPHFQALVSRGLHPIWIDSSNIEELFEYVIWLGTEGGMLNKKGMSKSVSEEAMNWFITNRNRLQEISPRQLLHVATIIRDMGFDERTKRVLLRLLLSSKEEHNISSAPLLEIVGCNRWKAKTQAH